MSEKLREAVENLFAGGFIDAGWKGVQMDSQSAQWALELEHRLKPIRAALAEPAATITPHERCEEDAK